MNRNINGMWKAINNFVWDEEKKRYTLSFNEFFELTQKQANFEGISCAFDYGFIKGMRYMKAQQKKAGELNG